MTMLKLGGYLNIVIAIVHMLGLAWAHAFFEATGVGKEMEEAALIHPLLPWLITLFVTFVFVLFGLYGIFSDNPDRKLPFEKVAIFSIAAIYILRGTLQLFSDTLIKGEGVLLGTIYSGIAVIIGHLYLIGGLTKWGIIKVKER